MIIEPQTGSIIYANSLIIIAGIAVITVLLVMFGLLVMNNRMLKASQKQIDNYNALRETFIDADNNLVYLKDENLKYVFVNKAVESFYKKPAAEIIGFDDYDLTDEEFAGKRRQTDLAVLERGTLVNDELEWNGRLFRITKFPVQMLNGKTGVGAYIIDKTEDYERERKQEKVLIRHMILADVLSRSFKNTQEQLDYVLHEALRLTESQYGYIYFYDEEKREFTLNSWTKGVLEQCEVTEKQTRYQLENTGIWGEVVRQRKPIVVNNFDLPNPLKKGYPQGHVELKKFMSVPVFIDDRIVAVAGLANKQNDYDENDVYETTLLLNGAWHAVERREAQEKLATERNKYLQTLISIGDGVLVVDKNGYIEMLNNVAEKLTGWTSAEAVGKHYKEVFVISHEQEDGTINDPIENVFTKDTVQELGNHALLISRNGVTYYLEDSAAPIKDDNNVTVGVVLVFRDVSEKKEQRKKIEYLSFHDSLTGLYNRRFFEEELNRLDTKRNLPISIIMGDVNGLKLTNDIFGHAFGDILLKKVADVLRRACRADDIIARWGGDEFVMLLPGTNINEAEQVIERIKAEFSQEKVKAIKCSISMGADTKTTAADNLIETLNRAEEKMYAAKATDSNEYRSIVINTIISTLHENSPEEREHSLRVSKLCQEFGKELKLSKVDNRKLKEAGFFHDIGKIALNPRLLKSSYHPSSHRRKEIIKHSIVGYRILNSFDHTANIAELVLAHHENWDGSGYPKGLKGEEIPLLARIIRIAESYDRMVNQPEDSQNMSKTEAVSLIRNNAGILFDPELAELFANMIEKS